MLSEQHSFIFVHINKTGGTSIEKMFDPDADHKDVRYKHADIAYYRKKFPRQFREYFKFAFVRNPWDWLVSRYHWSRDRQQLFDYSFQEMLQRLERGVALAASAPWLEKEALRSQFDRLALRGKLGVDFVGRFERLQRDFDVAAARIGLAPCELPHVFATAHSHYVDYYDDAARAFVAARYKADIDAFGYRFGD
ncbi:MAG: sulfotransferase family 2 domain-containing protein [Casimicrobiaceae bacterium]